MRNRHQSRTIFLFTLLTLIILISVITIELDAFIKVPFKKRFIYNCDASNLFIYKDPPMKPEDLYSYIDEVADNSVTTFFMSPNYGMPVIYQSDVTETLGDRLSEKEWEEAIQKEKENKKKGSFERGLTNLRSLQEAGHDPMKVIIDRAREKGMEVFISFRMNETHDVQDEKSKVVTDFWENHPEWRVGKHGDEISPLITEIVGGRPDYRVSPIVQTWFPGAMNFAIPEVRKQRMAELRECCERYDIDGLDMDFQRFPIYFPQGKGSENIELMNDWIREVRAMVLEVGRKKGKRILLSARILAKPDQNLAIGLDPFTWAKEGLIDFVTVSHYLRNDFPLPVKEYRKRIRNIPIYASIEVEKNEAGFRKIASELYKENPDGIMMFNYFTWRQGGREPDFKLLNELGDPKKLQSNK